MENKLSYEEVEVGLRRKLELLKVAKQVFLAPLPKVLDDPPYYSFYRPKGAIVTIKYMEFEAPLDIIYASVNPYGFNNNKRGSYYKTKKYPKK